MNEQEFRSKVKLLLEKDVRGSISKKNIPEIQRDVDGDGEIDYSIKLYTKAEKTLGQVVDDIAFILSGKKDKFSKDRQAFKTVKEKLKLS